MLTQKYFTILLFVLSISLYACGGSSNDAQETAEQASTEAGAAAQTAEEATQQAVQEIQKQMSGDGEAKEIIDFRTLKAQLPDELNGMERTSHTGEKVGAMGFNMSMAKAEYRSDKGEIEVSLIDFAGLGMAKMSLASWTTIEVDRETDTGYERTTTIDGYKAFEEYDRIAKKGEISIIAGGRYIVNIEGKNVEEGAMREALDALDLKAIMSLQ